jgi:hypothetical protein
MGGDATLTVRPLHEVACWHALGDSKEVYSHLGTSESGLSSTAAADRLRETGPNRLTPPKKVGFLTRLWRQLNNVLILILIVAAAVVGGLQEWAEFGLILGVITINTTIGMIQVRMFRHTRTPRGFPPLDLSLLSISLSLSLSLSLSVSLSLSSLYMCVCVSHTHCT